MPRHDSMPRRTEQFCSDMHDLNSRHVRSSDCEHVFVGSLSVPIGVLGLVSQMNRLRQVMRQMSVYLNALSLGMITFFSKTFD